MFAGKKVVVVMPACNAAQTLRQTYDEVMAQNVVDFVVVVDDGSIDETSAIARTLPKTIVHTHPQNQGYGANQKICYKLALEEGADIIIMVHPDYQYTPKLIPAMTSMIGNGLYVSNRFLTLVENIMTGAKLSEYHSGYRAFSRELLEKLPLERNSDDFVFDNQMLAQILWLDYKIAEVSCPTKYFAEASSINFQRSLKYGFGCLNTAVKYRLAKVHLIKSKLFPRR
jgi:glycosyltransferase involved in cell wall biosynthesis